MQHSWINKKNNDNLIIFMNGWGMNYDIAANLAYDEFDILHINNYINENYRFDKNEISKYKTKYLIAWSMGVYVSNLFYSLFDNFDKKIAISGTNKIIDDNYGIPNKIYNYTIKFFNDDSFEKFKKNIFMRDKYPVEINKSTKELKDELIAIKNTKINSLINYDKAIIPKQDVIVPYKNQIAFWNTTKAEIVEINSPHYVFDKYNSWRELIC